MINPCPHLCDNFYKEFQAVQPKLLETIRGYHILVFEQVYFGFWTTKNFRNFLETAWDHGFDKSIMILFYVSFDRRLHDKLHGCPWAGKELLNPSVTSLKIKIQTIDLVERICNEMKVCLSQGCLQVRQDFGSRILWTVLPSCTS